MWGSIAVATALWGVAPLIEKAYVQRLSVATIAIMFAVMSTLLVPVVWLAAGDVLRRELPTLLTTNRALLGWGLLGLVVSLGALGAYLHAMGKAGDRSFVVVSVTATFPLISALLLWALNGEPITPRAWAGILLVTGGTLLLL